MKKLYIILAVLTIVLGGSAIAAWVLNAQSNATGFVTSDGMNILTFQYSNLDFGTVDTSNGSVTQNTTDYVFNSNAPLNMSISFESVIIDLNDSCNNTGDLSFNLLIDYQEYFNGDNIIIGTGNHSVTTVLNSQARSCPQNFTTQVLLMEN